MSLNRTEKKVELYHNLQVEFGEMRVKLSILVSLGGRSQFRELSSRKYFELDFFFIFAIFIFDIFLNNFH